MREPKDSSARKKALDTRCSFIVSAPAGAGKTELLTQRMLSLLAECEEPEEVLAITFTRKAAAEMQRRIIELLAEASAGGATSAPEHRRNSLELARRVVSRSDARGWGLREQPARLSIFTIDALCAHLSRRLPLLSGVGVGLGVAEEPQELLQLAARRLLDELEGNQDKIREDLRHLMLWWSNDELKLEEKLAELLGKRDQWLPFLTQRKDEIPFCEMQKSLREELLRDLHAEAVEALKDYRQELLILGNHAAERIGSLSTLKGRRAFGDFDDGSYWRALAILMLTEKDQVRKRWNKNQGFIPEEKEEKARIGDLGASLARDQRAIEALKWMRIAPELESDPERERCVEALANLLVRLGAHLDVVFIERGEMDYTGVALAAERALGNSQAPGDLALRLDYRLRHILVDEFQDTSNVQFRLLERLVEGWKERNANSNERPSTLFLVGDGMQSCYRFRDSDLRLFLLAGREGINGIKLDSLRLSSNFRSFEEIVSWNDEHFSKALPKENDIAMGAIKHSPAHSARGSCRGAGATCDLIQYEERAQAGLARRREAERILELVRTADADDSVAILARSRAHFSEIIRILNKEGIPFHGEKIDKLLSRAQIADLCSLTTALLDSHDRLAWLALLRSPLCGLGNRSLHMLANAAGNCDTALTQAIDACEESDLEMSERAGFRRFRQVVKASLHSRQRRSLRRWIEGAWLALGGSAYIRGAADVEDAESFFKMLEQLQGRGQLDARKLEQALDRLFAAGDTQAKLKLMTIHEAKGLEFDTVIIPGLGARTRGDESPPLLWEPWWNQAGERRGVLMELDGGNRYKPSLMYKFLREREKRRADLEEARLLYIACTRAIRRLHLLGTVMSRGEGAITLSSAGGALRHLAPTLDDEDIQWLDLATSADSSRGGRDFIDDAPAETPADVRRWRVATDWMPSPAPPSLNLRITESTFARDRDKNEEGMQMQASWDENLLARHLGTVLHAELEAIAREGEVDFNSPRRRPMVWRAQLRQLGVLESDADALIKQIENCLDNVLADPRGRWILQARPDAAWEMELLGVDEEGAVRTMILDRCFTDDDDGTTWIVDYKTATPAKGETRKDFLRRQEERYGEQMRRYADAYSKNRGVTPRLALYFPAIPAWQELRSD